MKKSAMRLFNYLKQHIAKSAKLSLLSISIFGTASLHAQMVTVNPPETTGALSNPLMGFRPDVDKWNQNPAYPTIVRHYIKWNEIENNEADTVQKIRDYCNTRWAALPAANIKVIPRVYIDWDSANGNEYWPADLQTGDWSSQQFKDRVVRLIGRLGEVWDNDPRVAWVQTGIIGYWGEQENPVGVDEDGWGQRLSDAFTTAFQNKKMIVRNMDDWPSPRFGVYWDSYAHPSQPSVATKIRNFNSQGRHLSEIVEGEVAYNWGEATFDPLFGGEPSITLNNTQFTDNMIDVIRELHCTGLGWIASYSLSGANGTNPVNVRANAARMQREFGYRFHINEFSSSARVEPGSNVDVQFKVKNNGSAPFYENWPVALVIVDQTTRQLLWKATIPNVDIRTWHPGSNYNKTTRTYQTPPKEHLISTSIPLPANMPVGEHLIGVTILEPLSRTPGVFFDVPNFFKQSQTQPLCKIGIGTDALGHTLDGIMFDDLVNDEARSYTMTPQGPNYTLTLLQSSQGTISQSSVTGSYAKDTGVEVKATGKLGHGFSSWGGALAGSTRNPAIVAMDANKNISANYVSVPVYRLNTSSSNGAITLSPSGGIYSVGTVVTVTAEPSSGYVFSSWSGDLSGSASSTTITMTGDKSVNASFMIAPITGPTSFRVNCGGPAFTAGDGNVFNADGVRNSGGTAFAPGSPAPISGTTDDVLYQSERYGNSFSYNIPLINGDYQVTLMFAEINFNSAGSRVFNVAIEGVPVISNLDIFSRVGKNAAYNEDRIVTVNDGTLNIAFTSVTNNAKISAIKVVRSQRPNSFTLTTSSSNGSVILSPPGGVYDAGEVVTISSMPNNGYAFGSWAGDATGTSSQTTITMDANKSVIANINPVQTYSIITTEPNGMVDLNPPGGIYADGTVVTALAIPNSGFAFGSWSGDLNGSDSSATITMNSDKNVTANFTAIPSSKMVLLVVADATALGQSDMAIRDHIQNASHTVQVISDELTVTGDATGKALIVVSSSVTSGNINTKFHDVAVPVINWEIALQDDFRFTGNTSADSGTTGGTQTSLNIINPDHPLAAGLSAGSHSVTTSASGFSWGVPTGNPIIIAQLNDGSNRACFYAYESGAAMASGTAPARRVHLFLQNETFASLNANGLALFDAAISWAMGDGDVLTWTQAPIIQGNFLILAWEGGGTLQKSINMQEPWIDITDAVSPYLHPMSEPTEFFRVKK